LEGHNKFVKAVTMAEKANILVCKDCKIACGEGHKSAFEVHDQAVKEFVEAVRVI
jgi:hypothetical protein